MNFTLEPSTSFNSVDLVVRGDWTAEMRAAIIDGHADGLVLNYARGFRERNLDFIGGLPLRNLDLLARTIKDLTPIYSLADRLENLHVVSGDTTIDLSRFPALRNLSCDWYQARETIMHARHLERLFFLSYTEPDLRPLSNLTLLRVLGMKDRPAIETLDGLEDLPNLVELALDLAGRLSDIDALDKPSSAHLEKLVLTGCRRVSDLEPVRACTRLKNFEFNSHEVSSLAPLAGLDLTWVILGYTVVLDGDLSPIANMPNLEAFRLKNRPNYSPSANELRAVAEHRRASRK